MTGPVRSVSQAFAILRLLAREGQSQTLSDVARATGLSVSSCLNLLRTLVAEGALEAESGKRYRLASGWSELGAMMRGETARLVARAQPLLTRFAESHEATIGLWHIEPRERLGLIAIGECGSATRIHMAIGQRQPIGGGATGRALAAAQDAGDPELGRWFAMLRWQRTLDYPTYAGQVAAARTNGYALDDGFAYAGVCSIACVLPGDPLAFCLSASIFAGSRDADSVHALGLALIDLARAISRPNERS